MVRKERKTREKEKEVTGKKKEKKRRRRGRNRRRPPEPRPPQPPSPPFFFSPPQQVTATIESQPSAPSPSPHCRGTAAPHPTADRHSHGRVEFTAAETHLSSPRPHLHATTTSPAAGRAHCSWKSDGRRHASVLT
ncbi:hypothetical protein Tsubulata_001962 [Turnera subulata]|uniref:Uncharacterized protein n=1 Tax=Turnera subulata TaxID=218843 RepID=A0A9Q0J236_9ROSI|nr:hypothetical protein Tsubulata_001962 [Turnera subulata]